MTTAELLEIGGGGTNGTAIFKIGVLLREKPKDWSQKELLAAKKIDYPRFAADATFKKATKSRPAAEKKLKLPFEQDNTDAPEDPF